MIIWYAVKFENGRRNCVRTGAKPVDFSVIHHLSRHPIFSPIWWSTLRERLLSLYPFLWGQGDEQIIRYRLKRRTPLSSPLHLAFPRVMPQKRTESDPLGRHMTLRFIRQNSHKTTDYQWRPPGKDIAGMSTKKTPAFHPYLFQTHESWKVLEAGQTNPIHTKLLQFDEVWRQTLDGAPTPAVVKD